MRFIRVVVMVLTLATVFVGFRWYSYVTNTESPYNEVGIELNSRMPGPINKWGCDRLHQTFGNMLPPYGCQAINGTEWL